MTSNAISVAGLRKSFAGRVALDGIEFVVPSGTVFALLGPNGSGKTTTVKILSTQITADDGEIRVGGHDVRSASAAVRAAIGVTGQGSAVDPWLTGRENLRLMARLHHLAAREGERRVASLLGDFGLLDDADRPAMGYSGGMTRRLDLAMTLLGEPRILFLDEPTSGLDPRTRRQLWDRIRALVDGGVTVFLTTQYLEEADALASRVAVLDHGRLVANGTPEELKALVPGSHVRVEFDDRVVTVPCDATLASLRSILADLNAPDNAHVSIVQPDLDDAFLSLTEAAR
jgi:ABC-2 type transport system ATP-binding protein